MTKYLYILFTILLCSCGRLRYSEWETQLKYMLVTDCDTIFLEKIDTLSYNSKFYPCASINNDSSAIVIRFMDDKCCIPEYEYEYKSGIRNKNRVTIKAIYGNCKLNIIDFKSRRIRDKECSKFSGEEIDPKKEIEYNFVPVI